MRPTVTRASKWLGKAVGAAVLAVALAALTCSSLARETYHPPQVVAMYHVIATAYNANDGHEWCPSKEACGSVVYAGGPPWEGTVAVSRDLRKQIPMGTRLRIRGYDYIVRDLMGPAIHGARIDIYCTSLDHARSFGVQKVNVEVIKESNDG